MDISAIIVVFLLTLSTNCTAYKAPEFLYREVFDWARIYPDCGGSHQSPVNIDVAATITKVFTPKLDLSDYYKKVSNLILENDGDTAKVELKDNIIVRGGPLMSNSFKLEQFHFHFGKNHNGSEHTVNRFRFAFEIHFVHKNLKYANLTDATKHPDGVVVIAVFGKLDEKNVHGERLSFITKNLNRIVNPGYQVVLPGPFNLSSIIPHIDKGYGYWTYNGSFTTPFCQEVVQWIVSDKPLLINANQIAKFNVLKNVEGVLSAGNNRYLQHLNGRQIRHVPA